MGVEFYDNNNPQVKYSANDGQCFGTKGKPITHIKPGGYAHHVHLIKYRIYRINRFLCYETFCVLLSCDPTIAP